MNAIPAVLLVLGLALGAPLSRADEESAPTSGEVYDLVRKSEQTSRISGSVFSAALGAALVTSGVLSPSATPGTQATYIVGGGTLMLFSLRGFFVPTAIEEFVTRYGKSPDRFEPEAFAYLRETAYRNRRWNGAISSATGALIVGAGLAVPFGTFLGGWTYVAGGLLILEGVGQLLVRSPVERILDRYKSGRRTADLGFSVTPVISRTSDGRPQVGGAVTFAFR